MDNMDLILKFHDSYDFQYTCFIRPNAEKQKNVILNYRPLKKSLILQLENFTAFIKLRSILCEKWI